MKRQVSATPWKEVETKDNVFERVGMSLYNALRLDPEASVRALVSPESLPPGKHTTLSKQFTHGREGLESFILSELTNPMVLAGAAMSFRWPILDPSKFRNAANTLKQYERWIPSPLRKILGLNELFVGTPIPLIASRIPAEADNFINRHFSPVGEGILRWRKAMGRRETIQDEIRWFLKMDNTFSPENVKNINKRVGWANETRPVGQKLSKLRPDDLQLPNITADEHVIGPTRRAFGTIRAELSSDPARLERMVKFQNRAHGIDSSVDWITNGYAPRLTTKNYKAISDLRQRYIEGLIANQDVAATTVVEKIRRYGQASAKVTTPRLAARYGQLIPDSSDLSLLPKGTVSERALQTLSALREKNLLAGKPPSYSLRFAPSVQSYAFSTGRSYAWSFLGHGDSLIKESQKVLEAERHLGMGLNKTEMLRNVFLPGLMGTTSFDQFMRATEWAGVRHVAWSKLHSPSMASVPLFARTAMRRMLEEDSLWHPAAAGSKISNYFYASTLGANIGSAAQNLLQPIVTTAPFIGLKNTMAGITRVVNKIPEFIRMRSGGMTEAVALRKLFPEFVQSGGELGALSTEIALKESADIARGGLFGIRSKGAKLRDVLMAPFRSSELFNRLSTFEGARIHAEGLGLGGREALDRATEVVNLTQMWGGGASTPAYMSKWWGPFKQFLTFPSKLLGYTGGAITPTVTSEGVQWGIGGGFDPGTLGRALFASATAYEVAKEFSGADISRSLLFGGLPLPQEQSVLSPLPVLPPLVSITAGGVQDLVTGGTENIKRSLPMLVPGGIQMARLSQSYVPQIAKWLNRSYADPEHTTPDGKVPMYDSGGNLTGYKDAYQLFLSNIGIPGKLLGPNGEANTQEIEKYFLGQRDTIRQMRSKFIDAAMEGDMVTAEKIQRQYMTDYGSDISIRDQDWKAAEQQRLIPRLERIAKTLPPGVRDQFLQIAHTSLAGSGAQYLGVDPLLLNQPRKQLFQSLQQNQQPNQQGFGAPQGAFP